MRRSAGTSVTDLLDPAGAIVVAFRDQDTGPALLRWAVLRAHRTGQHVTVLHAIPDASLVLPIAAGGKPYGTLIAEARQTLDDASREVVAEHPGTHITANVHCGDIVEALVGLSADAALLVVGADRVDDRTGEYLGSIGQQVALGSSAPVAVIPRSDTLTGHAAGAGAGAVVVGVDGSAESHSAVRVAAVEAHRVGAPLLVVTASVVPPPAMGSPSVETAAEAGTAPVLEELTARYPALVISRITDNQRTPVASLKFHAARAVLLVIGRHGSSARPGILLGSVTHTLLLDPVCPTLVVTPRVPPGSAALQVPA